MKKSNTFWCIPTWKNYQVMVMKTAFSDVKKMKLRLEGTKILVTFRQLILFFRRVPFLGKGKVVPVFN
jgi:hypothetical protein